MNFAELKNRKALDELTMSIPAEDFEQLGVGDGVELDDGTILTVKKVEDDTITAEDEDGDEVQIVSDVDPNDDEVDEETLQISQEDYLTLQVGDEIELDDDTMLTVSSCKATFCIATDEDGNEYNIVPEGVAECKIDKKKVKEKLAKNKLGEDNPWHGANGRFPVQGKPNATVWSLYGKRRWIKKHPKTGKLYLKSINVNHKKWGSPNRAQQRVKGKFAKTVTAAASNFENVLENFGKIIEKLNG
jgi:hypothetical protein